MIILFRIASRAIALQFISGNLSISCFMSTGTDNVMLTIGSLQYIVFDTCNTFKYLNVWVIEASLRHYRLCPESRFRSVLPASHCAVSSQRAVPPRKGHAPPLTTFTI